MTSSRRLAAIMFTDIDYQKFKLESESKASDLIGSNRGIFESITHEFDGEIIQYYVDGTLCTFSSAVDAVRCACKLQLKYLKEPNIQASIGIHVGDVILSGSELKGDSVNVTSRIRSLGVPGSVMISGKVWEEIKNKGDLPVKYVGKLYVENNVKSMKVYAINSLGLKVPRWSDVKGKLENRNWGKRIIRNPAIWLVTILITIGIFYFKNDKVGELAILPFKNYIPNSEEAYLVEGIHDALISEFRKKGIPVIPRTRMAQYSRINTPIKGISSEMKVDWVLESSLRLEKDSVNRRDSIFMDVRLIDGVRDNYVLLNSYRDEFRNIFSIYDQIIQDVSLQLGVKLLQKNDKVKDLTNRLNSEAYKAYLRGKIELFSLNRNSLDQALAYFNRAKELDPEFALAYAGIAIVWVSRLQQRMVKPETALPIMNHNIEKALTLDSNFYEVQYSYALTSWCNWDFSSSLKSFEKAIKIQPNNPDILGHYGNLLVVLKRFEEANAVSKKSIELDPNHPVGQLSRGMILILSRQYEKVIKLLTESLKNSPNDSVTMSIIRTAYHLKGMEEKAYKMFNQELGGDSISLNVLQSAYDEGGYQMALKKLAENMEGKSKSTYFSAWRIAKTYAMAGAGEDALKYLEKAYEEHDLNMVYINVDPIFDFIRKKPRFQNLIERMEFPD